MARYLADGFELRSTVLQLDGQLLGLICVLPHPDGCAPFKTDGRYRDSNGRERLIFRAGDVFARHGTSSEPWNAENVRRFREEVRHQERKHAREELQAVFVAAQAAGERATQTAAAPASALTWQLDEATLTAALVEQLRAGDEIPLTLLLKTAPREASTLAVAGQRNEHAHLLDALACVIAQLIAVERPQLAERAIGALAAIYNTTFTHQGLPRQDLGIAAADVQLAVFGRVLALGALGARERVWPTARALAMQHVHDYDASYWQNWLFHGKVAAARANLLQDPERPRTGRSPLVIAQEHILRLPCLRPDIDADDEAVITSLCRFDMLAAFAALGAPDGKSTGAFLASFGEWYASRTDPIVVELIAGGPMREVTFPGDDAELADAIRAVGQNASRTIHLINGWHGYQADAIQAFLEAHPPAPA